MIGLFNDNFPPVLDGVALTVQNYAYWLHMKGENVRVITPYAPHARDFIDSLPYPVDRYTSVPIPMRKPYRYGLPEIDLNFKRKLGKQPFDLVHAHCPFTSGTLARHLAKKRHIPIVATFHSKYRQDFERAIPSTYIVNSLIKDIVKFYEKVDEVWIPQAAVEPTLREYGFKGSVEVVENGNDFYTPAHLIKPMREEMRAELGVMPDEMMLLFVGQHIWEKNIGLILDSLALIKEQPWQLFMVGTGYAVRDIRTKIAELGLSSKVTLLGNILDRERLKRVDAAADLFLFPSLYDNAPLVVREAAALHTPAVMISGSTAAEVIRDKDNGFLTVNDPHEYANLVKYLIGHKAEVERVGLRASLTLTRSWENIIDEVQLRYKDIINRYHLLHG